MKPFRSFALLAVFFFACAHGPSIDLRETDIAALQAAMQSGDLKSQDKIGRAHV